MYQSYSAKMYHPCCCCVTNLDTMGLDGMVSIRVSQASQLGDNSLRVSAEQSIPLLPDQQCFCVGLRTHTQPLTRRLAGVQVEGTFPVLPPFGGADNHSAASLIDLQVIQIKRAGFTDPQSTVQQQSQNRLVTAGAPLACRQPLGVSQLNLFLRGSYQLVLSRSLQPFGSPPVLPRRRTRAAPPAGGGWLTASAS